MPVLSPGSIGRTCSRSPSGTPSWKLCRHKWPRLATSTIEVAGERVDDGDADAVQAAGDLVAAAAELAARVQHGQRQRDGRHVLAGSGVGGDAAAVVLDPDPAVVLQGEHDPVAVAGERLVDRVVDDLPDQVVQAALAGGPDVHAGSLADRLEALEDLDGGGVVLDPEGWCAGGCVGWSRRGLRRSRTPLRNGPPGRARARIRHGADIQKVAAVMSRRPGVHGTASRPAFHVPAPRIGGSVDENRP